MVKLLEFWSHRGWVWECAEGRCRFEVRGGTRFRGREVIKRIMMSHDGGS